MQIVIELLEAQWVSFMKHLIYIEGEINPGSDNQLTW